MANPVLDALMFGRRLLPTGEPPTAPAPAPQPAPKNSWWQALKYAYEDKAADRWARAGQEAIRQEILRRSLPQAGALLSEVAPALAPVVEAAGPTAAVGTAAYGLTRRAVHALPMNAQDALIENVGGTVNQAMRNLGVDTPDDSAHMQFFHAGMRRRTP